MSQHALSRTELLIGKEALNTLTASKVAVVGIGGVGSFTVEALVRAGIGKLILVDDDEICLTNINRQVHATYKTVGRPKVEVMKERVSDINPKCEVKIYQSFVAKDNIPEIISDDVDYVVDAIDTVTSKLDLISYCKEKGINVISSMGTGNKMDPTQFRIDDIFKTNICPLAKVMRRELKKRNIDSLKVLYSTECPTKPKNEEVITCKEGCICTGDNKKCLVKRQIPASISFVPPVAGMVIAGEVIKDLIAFKKAFIKAGDSEPSNL